MNILLCFSSVYYSTCIARFIHTTDSSCLPFETNTIESSNALCCHGTKLSFRVLLVVAALSRNPIGEREVGSIPFWHVAMAELRLEFTHFFKSYAPNGRDIRLPFPPVETNTYECSIALSSHGTLSFFRTLGFAALIRNPLREVGAGRIYSWHVAVAELRLEFTQFLKPFVPKGY